MKKIRNRMSLGLIVLLLAGCGNTQGSSSLWDSFISLISQFILMLSHLVNNRYGIGIILFTIITRLILLPIMQYQIVTTRKTAELQPEMNRLREQYSSRDRETQMALQAEIKKLNEKHGVNQWAGCLPALIQLPIMLALFQAITVTKELQTGHFLWTELGKADPLFILPLLSGFFTWLNSYLTLQGQSKNAQQLKFMQLYFLPAMIFFISISANSALALYWLVGGIFAVLQTLLLNNPYKLKAEREAKIKQERAKARAIKKAMQQAYKK